MSTIQNLTEALAAAEDALTLIATPMRADGTYNRDRKACEQLARDALNKVQELRTKDVSPSQPVAGAPTANSVTLLGRGGIVNAPAARSVMQRDDSGAKYVVACDGACKGNPGPASWGAIVVENGIEVFAGGGYIGEQTNNIAELTAAIEGLSRTPVGAEVELLSDSQLMLKGVTEWRAGWERRNWKTSNNEPVKNKELFMQLYALIDARDVSFQWIRGHNGHPLNERCDKLANKAVAAREPLVME